jgi:hypothetical protein
MVHPLGQEGRSRAIAALHAPRLVSEARQFVGGVSQCQKRAVIDSILC